MIADKAFPYRGIALAPGQEFDADDEHVRVFEAVGHAHLAPEEGTQTYQTRVMTAGTGRRRRRVATS